MGTLKIVCCVCPLPSYIRFGAIVEKLREIDKMVRRSTRNSIVKSELPQVKVEVTTKNAVIKLERLSEEDIEKFSKKPIEEDEDEEVAINARKNFLDALDDSDKENEENENKENVASKVKKWKPTTLGQGQKIRRPLAPMRPIPKKEELSDYEKIRQENIAEQRLKFLQMMKEQMAGLKPVQKPAVKRSYNPDNIRRKKPKARKEYGTRSKVKIEDDVKKEVDDGDDSDDGSSSDEDDYQPRRKKRAHPSRWTFNPNEDILMPEDVTDAMLDDTISDFVSNKVYSQSKGTTCHQCRQKTIDQKTICRSGQCQGGRGLFCGVCLKNRYGMDIREALKDPNWWCPPCMDYCNCSICRNRIGKGATGPLTWLALEKGYPSVRHYLESLVKTKGTDAYDDE